jgi:glucose-6-phosphate 1-dehydrogenase
MNTRLILFGATGDLAKTKIIPALESIDIVPILYGRKEIDQSNYIQGELDEIKEKISDKEITHAYISLPPMYYETVLRQLSELPIVPRIAIEKPFGTSYKNASNLVKLIKDLGLDRKVYLVDHYLGKPALVELLRMSTEERVNNFNDSSISSIDIEAYETNTVFGRGVFYDSVGTIKDFVQSHMLAIIASILMQEGCEVSSTLCRQKVLEKIKYKEGSLVIAQYKGFRGTTGVNPVSNTETFASLDFVYDNQINISIKTGKALDSAKTNAIIHYKGRGDKKIIIRSPINSYEVMLFDFLSNNMSLALSFEEVMLCWRITQDILKAKENMIPKIYPQGGTPEKILEK